MSEGTDKNKIVLTNPSSLTTRGSGLVSRGLLDLTLLSAGMAIASSSEKARVLVCDDEEALVEVITTMLVSAGYEVRSTLNSLEALEIAREFQPDVAIIGEIMPRMDGFKLAPKLASFLPRTKIVLTAEAEPSDLETFRKRGWPFDILLCPFERQELLEKLRAWAYEAKQPEHPRILVVSSEEGFNTDLPKELNRTGYVAMGIGTRSGDGWSVYTIIEVAKTFQPDIVILYQDLFLRPELTGVDIAVLLLESFPSALFLVLKFPDNSFSISDEAWAYARAHGSQCETFDPFADELIPKVRAWSATLRPGT
jgi:CheY-like chemotaxis protein